MSNHGEKLKARPYEPSQGKPTSAELFEAAKNYAEHTAQAMWPGLDAELVKTNREGADVARANLEELCRRAVLK